MMRFAAVVLVLCTAGFAMTGAESFHRLKTKHQPRVFNMLICVLSIYFGAFSMALAVQVWMR